MAGNPLIQQGTLNRLRGSVIITDVPNLNVTAPYLGKEGISLALEGEATHFIETETGAVTSQEPYMMCSVRIHLLKSQSISDLYKKRMELNSQLGEITVRGDAATLSDYQLINCAIINVAELSFAGQDAGYVVTLKGYYPINSSMWNFS